MSTYTKAGKPMTTYATDAQLIERFKAVRQLRGLSTRQLAEAAGMSRDTLVNMELGRKKVLSIDHAAALATALGLDLRLLLSPDEMPVATVVYLI